MAISYIGAVTGTSTGGNITISLTSLSLLEGDIVVVATGWTSTADGAPGVSTSGYTELYDLFQNDTRDVNFSVSRKVMGSTPDTDVVCLGIGGVSNPVTGVAYALRGVDPTSPIGAKNSAGGSNSATVNPPIITDPTHGTIASGSVIIACGGCTTVNTFTATAPSGYSNISSDSVKNVNNPYSHTSMVAMKDRVSGSEDPGVFGGMSTTSLESWAAVTLSLTPAPDTSTAAALIYNGVSNGFFF